MRALATSVGVTVARVQAAVLRSVNAGGGDEDAGAGCPVAHVIPRRPLRLAVSHSGLVRYPAALLSSKGAEEARHGVDP